jgi:malonyl-CoA/methylmalonyl-CoA synthetase
VAIRDSALDLEKSYGDMLADALALRGKIEATLSDRVKQQLAQKEEVYIGVLAPGGYEFAVAIVAALATGAAIVPMSKLVCGV